MMFPNNNKAIIRKLSSKSLKVNKTRNLFAVLAIILTTVLFTSVFTIGLSLLDSGERATMRQVGTMAHGGFKYLTIDEYNKLKKHPLIKEHGMRQYVTVIENKELRSKPVEMGYCDKDYAKWGFCEPTTGKLPQKENEIATATWVLDMLHVPHKIGETIKIEYSILDKKYTKDFVLSGFWEGDKNIAMAGSAVVSLDFIKQNLQGINAKETRENGTYVGNISLSVMFKNEYNIEENLKKIISDTDIEFSNERYAINWAYISAGSGDLSIIPFAIIGLLIMISGYLLIYNVFYISVVRDTRFYGLLKTVGTTPKQLKSIIRRQAIILSLIGIPIGLVIGYTIGYLVVPLVMNTTTIKNSMVISANPAIFIGSALFSLITVFLSCRKPSKIASKISPVEAVRYTGIESKSRKQSKKSKTGAKIYKMAFSNIFRNRKKAIIVLMSLSLSIILFSCIYTLILSFNMDLYLQNSIRGDFTICDYSYFSKKRFSGADTVKREVCNNIENVGGVKRLDRIYYSYAYDKIDDHKIEVMKQAAQLENPKTPAVRDNMNFAIEYGKIDIQLYGLDDGCMDMYTKDMIINGEIDAEKFATGNYILINQGYECNYYDVGDKVTISLNDGRQKTFEVMALVNIVYTFDIRRYEPTGYKAYIPSSAFTEFVENPTIMKAQIFVDKEKTQDVENYIKEIQTTELDLEYRSKADYVEEYNDFINTFFTIGFGLSFMIAVIGILNFINTVLTSIVSRRYEFAMLQSVGMTKKQVIKMITFEGLYYAFITIGIVFTLGMFITYNVVNLFGGQMAWFVYNFNVIPIIICSLVLIIIGGIVPNICYRNINKSTIIERLREVE